MFEKDVQKRKKKRAARLIDSDSPQSPLSLWQNFPQDSALDGNCHPIRSSQKLTT